ncbi:hypothetical protein BDK92_4808 [Micromonospora pisi]|uniref:Uncharacterized protein n=1 Tax=Micromonospora pisi TaxID=589240 RepID=A0A495JP74_9ACTN|nr:hypothetical protein [Micromonospora pisi]RKR90435.1 hypothetical protein BDK92_4808 [Micromonospora pisi]
MSRFVRGRSVRDGGEGWPGGAGTGPQDDLARLLAAVSGSAHPDELAGEEAAISAFRAHHAGQLRPPAARRSVPASVARYVTVKVALASALAVAATGGVALAATTGAIPDALGGARWGGAPARPHVTPRPSESNGPGGAGPASTAPRDWCRSYQARTSEGESDMLDDPQFRALVAVAGGRNEVAGYCAGLLGGDADGGPPGADRSQPAEGRSAHPTGKPSYPPGKPTDLPGKPDKPGGGPLTSTPGHQPGRPTPQPNNRS